MATSVDLSNAHPGDVVVPLSDMLDLLSSRLEEEELDLISEELIRRRTTEVAAGDVVTAEMMNQILFDIGNLQTRVMVLEQSSSATDEPEILLVQPSDGVRINEELKVYGNNLDPDTLISVTMGGRAVTVFSLASHSKLLVFNVPPIFGIPEEGAEVTLDISNEFGSDSISVFVLRSQETELDTTFLMPNPEVPGEALEVSTAYDYTYTITAYTSLDATYNLIPKLVTTETDWSVEVKGGGDTLFIPKSQPDPSVHTVVLTVTTGAAGSADLSLRIEAEDLPEEEWGESDAIPLEIDETTEVNTEINFIKPPTVIPGMYYNSAEDKLTVPPVPIIDIVLVVQAELLASNETYLISEAVVEGDSGGVWTVARTNDATVTTGEESETHQVRVSVDLADDAPVATPDATLSLTIERQGSTEPPAVYTQTLSMLST